MRGDMVEGDHYSTSKLNFGHAIYTHIQPGNKSCSNKNGYRKEFWRMRLAHDGHVFPLTGNFHEMTSASVCDLFLESAGVC